MKIPKSLWLALLFTTTASASQIPALYCVSPIAFDNRLQQLDILGHKPTANSRIPAIELDRNHPKSAWIQATYRDGNGRLRVITREATASLMEIHGGPNGEMSIKYMFALEDEAGRAGQGGQISIGLDRKGRSFIKIGTESISEPIECKHKNPPGPPPGPGASGRN